MNECVDNGGHDCDMNATCDNNDGSFVCFCKDGYTGNGTVGECLGRAK